MSSSLIRAFSLLNRWFNKWLENYLTPRAARARAEDVHCIAVRRTFIALKGTQLVRVSFSRSSISCHRVNFCFDNIPFKSIDLGECVCVRCGAWRSKEVRVPTQHIELKYLTLCLLFDPTKVLEKSSRFYFNDICVFGHTHTQTDNNKIGTGYQIERINTGNCIICRAVLRPIELLLSKRIQKL